MKSLTVEQHNAISKLAAAKKIAWSTMEGEFADLIAAFRSEVKSHYFRAQRRRCCYCSIELQSHKLTYDAEHILDKAEYTEYTFDPANIAVACKPCNSSKSKKCITSNGLRASTISRNAQDYSIVHPHLDEWGDHLVYDEIGRIVPAGNSQKGAITIRICGIDALNSSRLADEFSVADTEKAETALQNFSSLQDRARKMEILAILEEMAQNYDHAGSQAVMKALRRQIE